MNLDTGQEEFNQAQKVTRDDLLSLIKKHDSCVRDIFSDLKRNFNVLEDEFYDIFASCGLSECLEELVIDSLHDYLIENEHRKHLGQVSSESAPGVSPDKPSI